MTYYLKSMEKLVFDESYASIYPNESEKYIRIVWKGYVQGEKFQNVLNTGLKLVQDQQLEAWCADLREMKVIKKSDQKWTDDVWFPQMTKTSLLKMGILNSKDVFNRFGTDQIITKASNIVPFDIMNFDSADECEEWIKKRD